MDSKHTVLRGYFITGSDTGVGKTWIGTQLVKQLQQQYPSVKVRKPVESGCKVLADGSLLCSDGLALFTANNERESLQVVTPLRYRAALAPDRAARLEGASLTIAQLTQSVRSGLTPEDIVLVEGAGGFCSPIADDGLNADLARGLQLDVVVVVEDRLGAINQALMTLRSVKSEGLKVAAVVLNQVIKPQDADMDNLGDLRKRTQVPVYLCECDGVLPSLNLQ